MEPDIFIFLAGAMGFVLGVALVNLLHGIEYYSGRHGTLWFDDSGSCRFEFRYDLEDMAQYDRLIFKVGHERKKNNSIYEQQNMKGE